MPPTIVRSFSKINLGLRIGPPRADGFHSLVTLYQTVALHDLVTVEADPAANTEIVLTASDPRVPTDARNTAYRMVELALDAMEVKAHMRIHLEKLLPPQGGMGAGSANAAAALLGLQRQFGVFPYGQQVPVKVGRGGAKAIFGGRQIKLAEEIGSDVPLFLHGGTVLGIDRGQRVMPFPDLPEMPCLVVAPGVGSSTPLAFRAWDERIAALTPEAALRRLEQLHRTYVSTFIAGGEQAERGMVSANGGGGAHGVSSTIHRADGEQVAAAQSNESGDLAEDSLLALVRTGIENDFEEVVFQQHPSLRAIKHALLGQTVFGEIRTGESAFSPVEAGGAVCAMLSGSGSSLFGLYRSTQDAARAQQRVEALGMVGVRCFQTHTIDRGTYWRTMFEQ